MNYSIFESTYLVPKLGPADSCWVGEHLLTGAYPGHPDEQEHTTNLSVLYSSGVRTWISLQTNEELATMNPYQALIQKWADRDSSAVKFVQLPIQDRKTVSDEEAKQYVGKIETLVRDACESKTLVYMHCKGGHGRTGTMISLLISQVLQIPIKQAISLWYKLHKVRARNGAKTKHKGCVTYNQKKQLDRLDTSLIRKRKWDQV